MTEGEKIKALIRWVEEMGGSLELNFAPELVVIDVFFDSPTPAPHGQARTLEGAIDQVLPSEVIA